MTEREAQRDIPDADSENAAAVGESVIQSVLQLTELRSVTAEYAEAGLEVLLDNPAIGAIPVVGSIRALVRGAQGIREALFTKKLISMLYAVGEVSEEDVRAWRDRIESEKGSRETGERILALVDRSSSINKAALIGSIFRKYLDGSCDRPTFLRAAEMIDAALTEDLDFLISGGSEGADDEVCRRLMAVGLMQDRSSRLLLENSQPPVPSTEGSVVRAAQVAK